MARRQGRQEGEAATSSWHRGDRAGSVETVYQNRWFKIRSRDGFFSLEYDLPQVAILPIVEDRILLVRVRRPLVDDEPWEPPAGGAEPGESRVEAARRELEEETGIRVEELERFKELGLLSEAPNRSCELLSSFEVRISKEEYEGRGEHEAEIKELRLFDAEEAKQAIVSGEFYLSSPVAMIARYLFQREQQKKR